MTTAICPGSFDPVTVGHVDIIRRARKMFDHVIVAVLVNPTKNPSFSLEERIGLLKRATKEIDGLEIVGFDGLLADYARTRKATVLVKGLRAVSVRYSSKFPVASTPSISISSSFFSSRATVSGSAIPSR